LKINNLLTLQNIACWKFRVKVEFCRQINKFISYCTYICPPLEQQSPQAPPHFKLAIKRVF
jgi:hypothetical protein